MTESRYCAQCEEHTRRIAALEAQRDELLAVYRAAWALYRLLEPKPDASEELRGAFLVNTNSLRLALEAVRDAKAEEGRRE